MLSPANRVKVLRKFSPIGCRLQSMKASRALHAADRSAAAQGSAVQAAFENEACVSRRRGVRGVVPAEERNERCGGRWYG
jgi:hypothetical protein